MIDRIVDAWQYSAGAFGQLEIEPYLFTWLAASIGLLVMTVWNATDAVKDKAALLAAGRNGDAKIALNLAIRTDVISAFLASITLSIGLAVLVMRSPEAFPENTRLWLRENFGTIFQLGLTALPAVMFVRTILNRLDRIKIIRRSH